MFFVYKAKIEKSTEEREKNKEKVSILF